MERTYDNLVHYWVVLFNNGTYKEYYDTYQNVVERLSDDQGYRLIVWDN